MAAGVTLVGFVGGVRALGRFLGTLPGGPGLALDAIDLLQFDFAGEVEVADGGVFPQGLNLLQVQADRGLLDADAVGDLALG